MGRLIYSSIGSLDGYVVDASGEFDWAQPDEEVHALVNELERPVGTYLFGRRMYETLLPWETMDRDEPSSREFAEIWRAADKIVYSTTLPEVSSARTRLLRVFDPEAVRAFKADTERDLTVGGPDLAGQAIRAGLVDEYQWFVNPVIVGGGRRWLPDGVRLDLDLVEERRFGGGVVFLRYLAR